jgi:squalene cyclase
MAAASNREGAAAERSRRQREPAYQKGVKYLLATQHADGSWYVRSRAPKFHISMSPD